jgi:hypothetical protein
MRNDIHSPKNIIPSDYEFVTVRMFDEAGYSAKEFGQHREITGGRFSNHQDNGGCDVCGTQMNNYAIFYHQKTNKYIRTGLECAGKIESGHEDEFKRATEFRKAAKRRKEARKVLAGRMSQSTLDLLMSMSANWTGLCYNDVFDHYGLERDYGRTDYAARKLFDTIRLAGSLIEKSSKYGLSDKQVNLIESVANKLPNLVEDYINYENNKRFRMENTPHIVEGKQTIRGRVISTKWVDTMYGSTRKMLVEDVKGYKVYGSVPSAIDSVNNGDEIEFTAALSASDDDPTFGFFKRPTKASYK